MHASYRKKGHNLLSSASLSSLHSALARLGLSAFACAATFQQRSSAFPLGQVQPGGESLCPLAPECAALSVLPPHLQMSPAPAAPFQTFWHDTSIWQEPRQRAPTATHRLHLLGRQKTLVWSQQLILQCHTHCHMPQNTKQGRRHFGKNFINVRQQLEFSRRCFKGQNLQLHKK